MVLTRTRTRACKVPDTRLQVRDPILLVPFLISLSPAAFVDDGECTGGVDGQSECSWIDHNVTELQLIHQPRRIVQLTWTLFFFLLSAPRSSHLLLATLASASLPSASSLAGSPRAARSSPFATPARSQFTKPLLSTGVRTAVWTKRDADLDRKLHDDDAPERISGFSSRGIVNLGALMILVFGLIALFCGYPIIQFYNQPKSSGSLALVKSVGSYNVGGINSTGQIPSIPGLPTLIDKDTPASAYGHTGRDGSPYSLMFSDEFNIDGRTYVAPLSFSSIVVPSYACKTAASGMFLSSFASLTRHLSHFLTISPFHLQFLAWR